MSAVQHDDLLACDQLVQALEAAWLPREPDGDRFYPHIPLGLPQFFAALQVVGPAQGRLFLDVGCGIGTKLLLARLLGWDYVTGLDRHPPYLDVARRLCPPASLYHADAFAFDGYGHFDVVYSYRLCVADDDQRSLEHHIVERMRPGALAIFPQGASADLGEALGSSVWRT